MKESKQPNLNGEVLRRGETIVETLLKLKLGR